MREVDEGAAGVPGPGPRHPPRLPEGGHDGGQLAGGGEAAPLDRDVRAWAELGREAAAQHQAEAQQQPHPSLTVCPWSRCVWMAVC